MKLSTRKRNTDLVGVLALSLCGLLFSGCPKPMNVIEGTTIPATDANVAVVQRVQSYLAALQTRDAAKILSMVSDSYHGHRGTASPEDDYNKAGLAKKLQMSLPLIKNTLLGVKYESIDFDATGSRSTVKLQYKLHVQLATTAEGGSRWVDKEQSQQMTFVKENGQWQFTSGV